MLRIKCLRCGGRAVFTSPFEAYGLPDAYDFEFNTYCVKCRDHTKAEAVDRLKQHEALPDDEEETRL